MVRLSRTEAAVLAAGLLLAAALILYHAFDAQPLDPVIETFPASGTAAAAEPASDSSATRRTPQETSRPEAPQQRETRAESSKAAASGQQRSGPVNLNTATREELMTLSGIGEVKADAIIAYRTENGVFQSVEQLLEVSGIGEKTLEKLRAQVYV